MAGGPSEAHANIRRVTGEKQSDVPNSRLTLKNERGREAVYSGWCPICEGIVLSAWDGDVTDSEVRRAWRCPGCCMPVHDVRRVAGAVA
jgi:hypothetical protein